MTTQTTVTSTGTDTNRTINLLAIIDAVGYSATVRKPMASKSYKNSLKKDLPMEWQGIIPLAEAEAIKKAAVNGSGKFTEQWAKIDCSKFSVANFPAEAKQGGSMAEIDAIVDAFKKGVKKLKPLDLEALKNGLESLELELAMAKD